MSTTLTLLGATGVEEGEMCVGVGAGAEEKPNPKVELDVNGIACKLSIESVDGGGGIIVSIKP